MTAPARTAGTTVLDSSIADLIEQLHGFHPALSALVDAYGELLHADLDKDQRRDAVAVLGGLGDGNIATLHGLILRRLADPGTQALASLPTDRKQTLRRLGAEYAATLDDPHTRDIAAEASAAIDGI